jgi:hypothetical protein
VANSGSVTELNLSDGSLVRVLSDPSYAFHSPCVLASDGTHLWVGNSGNGANSVTELNLSNGKLVRVVSVSTSVAFGVDTYVFDGTHLWVANYLGSSVNELNLTS